MKKGILAGVAIVVLTGVALSVAYATTVTGGPSAINVISSGAQITWATDIASDSQINYGTSQTNLSNYSTNRCDAGGDVTSHCVNLTNLTLSTLYYYKVTSCASGQGCGESSVSSFTSASDGGGGVPNPPSSVSASVSDSYAYISWQTVTDATHYSIDRSMNGGAYSYLTSPISATSYNDTGVVSGNPYRYRVYACKSGYGCSTSGTESNTVTYSTSDTTAPTAPTGFTATAISSSQIDLSWTASTDNVGVTGYKIYRGGTLWYTTSNLSYSDTGLTSNTSYSYYVQAYDAAGNISSPTASVSATTPSGTASCTTLTLTFQNNKTSYVIGETVTYTYACSPGGTAPFVEVSVLKPDSDITVYNSTSGSISQNTLGFGTSNLVAGNYTLRACFTADCSGGVTVSLPFTVTTVATSDTTAPTSPTGLSTSAMSSSQINLSWTASTDNVGVTGYKIYRGGTYLLTVTGTSYSNTGLSSGTNYSYYVMAIDTAGNISATSNTANSTTLSSSGGDLTSDTSPPTTPTGIVATKDVHNEVDLSWTASSDNVGVSFYHILRSQNGVWSYIGQSTNTTYNDYTVMPSTSYYYAVKAYDAAGYYSATSSPLFLNTPAAPAGDTTTSRPPSPIDFGAYFVPNGSYGSSTNLGWSDVSNETSYNVFERLQGTTAWILAKIRTSLTGLADAIYPSNTVSVQVRAYGSGTYEYKVSACNSYGCSDSYWVSVMMGGNTTNTTTGDTTPPSLSSLFVGEVTATTAKILWNTNEPANSWVWWGVSSSDYTNRTDYRCDAGGLVASHCVLVSGLYANTLYYIRAGSADAAGNFGELLGSFRTATSTTTMTSGSIPNAPSNLHLIPPPNASQVATAWNDNSTIEDKYNIERKVSGSDYAGSFLIQLGANATSYTDTTALYGTYYDYRVQACRSGYGCSAYVYLIGVGTPETAGQASPTTSTTTQTLSTGQAAVSVIRGSSYCDGSIGKTPFTLSVMPYGAAFFKMTMFAPTSASTIVTPGTYTLPNGSYRWEAVPYSGYTLSGKTSEDFKLDQYCSGTMSTTTTTTFTNLSIAPETTTQTFKPYIVLNGDTLMHVPYGGTFSEPGAKGYLTRDGASVAPKRLLGGLDPMKPGTYTITYQLLNSSGSLVASMTRMVIVDPPPVIETRPTQPTETVFETTPYVPSVETVATQEQYARYCDDPKHELECQAYANKKVFTVETTSFASGVAAITQEQFTTVSTEGVSQSVSLPTVITDAKQLNAVCAQSEYVEKCTRFLVEQGVLSKEVAASQVREVFAQAEEVTKIFTERIGARAFADSDGDGITNYDEVNIYKTDPNNADTNGDGIKDGEQLLAGDDPLAKKAEPDAVSSAPTPFATPVIIVPEKKVAYEDPRFAGNVKKEVFAASVTAIKSEPIAPAADAPATTPQTKITLEGKALPNSFVTIYIFSEPIVVTVKTNASGAWTYTLDKELPDGTHEVYSAITDTGGRILAKSEPLPFVKTAAAVSLGSPLLAPSQPQAPGFFAGNSLYVLIVIIVGVLGLAISIVGFISGRNKEGGGGLPPAPAA